MKQQRRRVIPIRDELNTWSEAKEELEAYRIEDPYVPEHKNEAERKIPSRAVRAVVEFELDPDKSNWSPFEVNSLKSKKQLFLELEDYIHDVLQNQNRQDRTLKYVASHTLVLKKTYTDPRGINPPEYSLAVSQEFQEEMRKLFANKNVTRIVTWLHVMQAVGKTELSVVLVFYRKLDASTLVIELYHPDLSQMDEHPAFDRLTEQLVELVTQIQDPQNKQTDAMIGLLDSELSSEEWSGYFPFLARYNTLPDHMFGYLWNAFLFVDRVCEPEYTLKEVDQIIYSFERIDVEVRKKVYLAFLFFLLRFRWYLFVVRQR
jgi:hypothetical protein